MQIQTEEMQIEKRIKGNLGKKKLWNQCSKDEEVRSKKLNDKIRNLKIGNWMSPRTKINKAYNVITNDDGGYLVLLAINWRLSRKAQHTKLLNEKITLNTDETVAEYPMRSFYSMHAVVTSLCSLSCVARSPKLRCWNRANGLRQMNAKRIHKTCHLSTATIPDTLNKSSSSI